MFLNVFLFSLKGYSETLNHLVIFLQLYAVKTCTGTIRQQKIYYQKLLTFSALLPCFKSVYYSVSVN